MRSIINHEWNICARRPVVVATLLLVVTLMALGCSGSESSQVNETLGPVGSKGITQNIEGFLGRRLAISGPGEAEFLARGTAKREGMVAGVSYSSWLHHKKGDLILTDAASPIEKCAIEVEMGPRACEVVASLYDGLTQAPFDTTRLVGLRPATREGLSNAHPTSVKIDVDSSKFARSVQAGIPVDEKAELDLHPTGANRFLDVEAEAELELQTEERGETRFEADVELEGDGLIEDIFYSMWLAGPEDSAVFLDIDEAEEVCTVDPTTGEEECEVVVNLEAELPGAPFNVTTLVGLTVIIREHLFITGDDAPVVLTGTVTESDVRTDD